MTLLEKLDYLMRKYGLNKNTLSKNANIKYTTLDSLWKKGYSNVKLSTLMTLARYFNVSVDYLVKDEITNPRYGFDEIYSKKELEVLELYRSADKDTQTAIDLILGYKASEVQEATNYFALAAARPSITPLSDEDSDADILNKK